MSAHLAQVKNRSWQRVARIRIYMGTLTQGWPVPPRAFKKKILSTNEGKSYLRIYIYLRTYYYFIRINQYPYTNAIMMKVWIRAPRLGDFRRLVARIRVVLLTCS